MKTTEQLANRLQEVLLDGTWIANTNYKEQLLKTSWQKATKKNGALNTIAALTFHVNYYIAGVLNVLEGGSLDIKDSYSYDMACIRSQTDWEFLINTFLVNAENLISCIAKMPEVKLEEVFEHEKYGTYQRNIDGMIEHCYYHLGQITLLNKRISL